MCQMFCLRMGISQPAPGNSGCDGKDREIDSGATECQTCPTLSIEKPVILFRHRAICHSQAGCPVPRENGSSFLFRDPTIKLLIHLNQIIIVFVISTCCIQKPARETKCGCLFRKLGRNSAGANSSWLILWGWVDRGPGRRRRGAWFHQKDVYVRAQIRTRYAD